MASFLKTFCHLQTGIVLLWCFCKSASSLDRFREKTPTSTPEYRLLIILSSNLWTGPKTGLESHWKGPHQVLLILQTTVKLGRGGVSNLGSLSPDSWNCTPVTDQKLKLTREVSPQKPTACGRQPSQDHLHYEICIPSGFSLFAFPFCSHMGKQCSLTLAIITRSPGKARATQTKSPGFLARVVIENGIVLDWNCFRLLGRTRINTSSILANVRNSQASPQLEQIIPFEYILWFLCYQLVWLEGALAKSILQSRGTILLMALARCILPGVLCSLKGLQSLRKAIKDDKTTR